MIIRTEQPQDIPAVHTVEREAFGRDAEANLVDQIRLHEKVTLSLVALDEENGAVLGHVLFTPVSIHSEGGDYPALGMGPVAVAPSRQRQGIGSRLIRAGLEMLRQSGHARVVVEGSPVYYARFGFQNADHFGLRCQFNPPPGCFMILELQPEALGGRTGTVYYLSEFQEVE